MSTLIAHPNGGIPPRHHGGMRTIAVFTQKGGSGKSTVAIHIAVMASRGRRVLLIDADPQGTVATWGALRIRPEPLVVRADPSNIGDILVTARLEGFDFAFVDCPPHAVAGTAALLRHADHVVIPVQPTMPDITATQRSVALIAAAGKPFSFVINRAPARAADVHQTREVMAHAGPVSPITIGDRRAYARALTSSLAVTEYARDDEKAVLEVLRYWLWLDAHHLEIDICKRKAA